MFVNLIWHITLIDATTSVFRNKMSQAASQKKYSYCLSAEKVVHFQHLLKWECILLSPEAEGGKSHTQNLSKLL